MAFRQLAKKCQARARRCDVISASAANAHLTLMRIIEENHLLKNAIRHALLAGATDITNAIYKLMPSAK